MPRRSSPCAARPLPRHRKAAVRLQSKRSRAAAMQEVVEQIHRDQSQREEQRGQQQSSQAALQRRGSTATKDKTTGNREETSDRDSGEPPPGKMQASQPSDGQPRSSAQTQQQRQRKVSGVRRPEARPARPEERDYQQLSTTTTPEQTQGIRPWATTGCSRRQNSGAGGCRCRSWGSQERHEAQHLAAAARF